MTWNLNNVTTFNVQFDNLGLSLSTWLGDFNIPMRTLVLLLGVVVVLRIRKVVKDKLVSRKANTYTAPKTLDLWNDNPFDDFA